MRLSTRIALSVTVLVPVMVLTAGLLLLGLVHRDLSRQQDAVLRERAAAVLPNVRTLLAADSKGRPRAEQNQQRKVLDGALDSGVRLAGQDGAVLLAVGPQPAENVPLPAAADAPVTVRDAGRAWRVLSVRVDGAAPGTLWLVSPSSAVDPQVAAVRRRVLLVAVLAAPVAGLLAFALAGRATASLRRLSARAAALDPGGGATALAHTPSRVLEVDELAAALGLLLARFDEQALRTTQALDTARSFSSAASHELRTPLTAMRTNLDVLGAHPDLAAAERAEVVAELAQDHARLEELLTALRTLAGGDLVEVSAFTGLDLGELVESAVAEAVRRHPKAVIDVAAAPGIRVFGWEAGLRIALANLVGNAVVHGSPPGGGPARVTVRLRAGRSGAAVLTVDDTGPGVPPEGRAAVFHRFHRRPDSPGSGLGLTLVAQQAALHRGTVAVGDAPPPGGCRFEMRLPLLRPQAPTLRLPARRDWLSGDR
ncbi:HAMP domain-containing sensor histidine kinase [Kitasatospora herbaricolor]|uniref:histidine kinase n=1 Tax=Kitasatospora herbaricolor TaxID=68217 RepID=A0ABZ1WJX9_9ACTN|nr:HAMP domain-containing sensor histidine kinase [Kitasatospora herbaricolor]